MEYIEDISAAFKQGTLNRVLTNDEANQIQVLWIQEYLRGIKMRFLAQAKTRKRKV